MDAPLLALRGICKRFGASHALSGVDFSLQAGEIHALCGENGAGKSTLGKILAGVHTADSGEIRLEGKLIHPTSPLHARELGIAMVHQELAFCPNLSVAENLCLGDLPRHLGFVNRTELRERARAMLATISADINPDVIIGTLSTGREQLVQIAAAVGTPVVDLYALTNPQHTPWQVESRVLFHDVPCRNCYKSVCPAGHHECLRGVTPERVAAAARELLAA